MWGAGGNGPARRLTRTGLDLVVPDAVVLLRPLLIRVAFAHVLVRVLDADGSHVNVAKRSCDVEDRRRRVPDPGVLHDRARLIEVGEEQHAAAPADDDAQANHADPEPRLLAAVEPPRRDFLAA